MNPQLFDKNSPGRLVPVTGVPRITHAFVPNQLPCNWDWPQELWPLLLNAHKALSGLNGTGKHLPNPDLVLRPLQNREAQKSSSLEGTYTDPKQQLLFEVDPTEPMSSSDPANAYREVFNYSSALRMRRKLADFPLSLRLIKWLHETLMTGVRGADHNPGHFRRVQNQVGKPARYVPPPITELAVLLDNLEKSLHAPMNLDPLVVAFVAHYQFEAIHPFMDGNGRVGRLLLALCIEEWCALSNQWLYMSEYFDRNKDDYIDFLFNVSAKGDWRAWIEFCLTGVVEQATSTLDRCERLIQLNKEFHERINARGGSVRLSRLVDMLFSSPIAIVARMPELLGVTYPTARKDLQKLEDAGVLAPLQNVSQLTYYSPRIYEITFMD